MRRTVLFLAVVAVAATGCNTDKVLKGRKVLDKEPAKAVALFRQAAQERPQCFECLAYLGYGLERTGDLAGAAEAYEQAAGMPDAGLRPEPVRQRLLGVYESLHNNAADADRPALATKAAELEATLKVARPWANLLLEEAWRKQMKDAAGAGDEARVREVAARIQGLYLPAERKQQAAADATDALRTVFIGRVTAALQGDAGRALADKGRLDATAGEVVLSSEFTIPTEAADPRFNPRAQEFESNARTEACLPLRQQLQEVVEALAPALGLKKVDAEGLDRVFASLYANAQAGIATYGGDKRPNPAGLPYLCRVRISFSGFATELFRFWE